jgi:hypothetical protein
VFIPGAKVYHIGSATSGGTASAFSIRQTVCNTYQVTLKNLPLPLLPVWLTLTFGAHAAALVFSFLPIAPRWLAENRKAVLQGLRAAARQGPKSLRKRRKMRHFRRNGSGKLLRSLRLSRAFDHRLKND